MQDNTIRFNEINLHGLVKTLLKNLWVIAALCISSLLCYTAASRMFYTPAYTSSATFMVSAKDSTSAYNSLTTTQSMATVFVEVFQSNVLREKIQQQLPEQEFDGAITVTTIPQTNLFIVNVTSPQPDLSFRALNLVVDNYSDISDYLFSNAQLEVIKDPIVPIVPSNPLNLQSDYPIVLLLTVLISGAWIVGIYLFRDTLKTPKAVRRKIDARLLRTIEHEQKNKTLRAKWRRKNTAPLITGPLISKHFIEDNLSLCSALEYHTRKRKQKVILVTSVGENEGKSTVAANLALAMAGKNRRVILLDCDFRKPSLHKIFEIQADPSRTLTHYLTQENVDPMSCLTEVKKHGFALGISQHTGRSITKLMNNGKLAKLLDRLRTQADYVILDTPPMLAAADAENIAPMADTAIVVARADFMPTASINAGLDRLRQSTPEVCGLVLNNYHTKIW